MGLSYSTEEQKGTTGGLALLAIGFLGALIGTLMAFLRSKIVGGILSLLLVANLVGLILLPVYAQKRMDAARAKYDDGSLADENWKVFADQSSSVE